MHVNKYPTELKRIELLITFLHILTVIHLKHSMCVGYIVLQIFYSYNSWHTQYYFPCSVFCMFTSTLVLFEVCVPGPVWLLSVVPRFSALLVCCSGIF